MLKWLFLLSLGATAHAAPLTVWIDPGHGGRDHGAVQGDVHECDINLAVSNKLQALLERDRRFQVQMTRTQDVFVSLPDRARMAKSGADDLFLSIHVNSSTDRQARGAEFYFQNQLPPDEESMFMAHQENLSAQDENYQPFSYEYLKANRYPTEVAAIVNDLLDSQRVQRSSELSRALKLNWRGSRKARGRATAIRQAPFFVLNQMRVPSTLVEIGF